MTVMILPKVLAFDVFGTVVDWRSSVIRESSGFLVEIGRADVDAAEFADAWRFRYIDVMRAYRESRRGFVTLDVLHREMLEQTLRAIDIDPGGSMRIFSMTGRGPGTGSIPGPMRLRDWGG